MKDQQNCSMVSVIIPSYNCRYVSRTIEDLYQNALEEIEVIVILDAYWPDPPIEPNKNLTIIHNGTQQGMRRNINTGVRIAKGKYILKSDDHCSFSKGFDVALKQHHQDNWISIPGRYSLDPDTWSPIRSVVHYEYATYPYIYLDKHRYGCGLVAKKWEGINGNNPQNRGYQEYYWKENQNRNKMLDEIMAFHGSCWFMTKEHFLSIDGLDETYSSLYFEPQEILLKSYLSGGKVVVNKYCWYAHMFKDKNNRGYSLDLTAMRDTERFGTWFWMNNKWPKAKYPIKWFIEKFWSIPGWPQNWEEEKIKWEAKYGGYEHLLN